MLSTGSSGTMSCVDVMYQPYASYFPYQRASVPSTDPFKKFASSAASKMHEPILDMGTYLPTSTGLGSGPGGGSGGHTGPVSAAVASATSSAATSPVGSSSASIVKTEEHSSHRHAHSEDSEKEPQPQNTQYLSRDCLLVTYFQGDIAANVDEHFSRALSQPSSFSAENQGSKPGTLWKDVSPMATRNFPPSFWNSSYQPTASLATSHHDLGALHAAGGDPYMAASSLHPLPSSLHQDPWRYPLSTQAHSYSHSVHDAFAYSSMASSSRFQPHYSSLLPTAAASRLTAVPGQCPDGLSKHTDSWSSRYHSDPLSTNLSSHHDPLHSTLSAAVGSGSGGIEAPVLQEGSKDMYWF